MEADIDRMAFWRAAKKMFETSSFLKIFKSKVGRILMFTLLVLVVNSLLSPILGTAITLEALVKLIKTLFGV